MKDRTWDSLDGKTKYKWQKMRNDYIRLNPLCVVCMENGIVEKADVVDHILPLQYGGDLFSLDDIQSLCNKCHIDKSSVEGREEAKATSAVRVSQELLTVDDWNDEPRIEAALKRVSQRQVRLGQALLDKQ